MHHHKHARPHTMDTLANTPNLHQTTNPNRHKSPPNDIRSASKDIQAYLQPLPYHTDSLPTRPPQPLFSPLSLLTRNSFHYVL